MGEYRIKLQNFEGPLDLLLFFITRDKLNIYDIPIHTITEEYLQYIQIMKDLKIEVAGEFILMASMLMRIKAKMLLPSHVSEDETIEDPRTDLVQQLIEYKRFKQAASEIHDLNEVHSFRHDKGMQIEVSHQQENLGEVLHQVSLFDLLVIFNDIMNRLPKDEKYELFQEEFHVTDEADSIRAKLTAEKKISFLSLFKEKFTKLKVVVTFMAVLELINNREIIFKQKSLYGDIYLEAAAA